MQRKWTIDWLTDWFTDVIYVEAKTFPLSQLLTIEKKAGTWSLHFTHVLKPLRKGGCLVRRKFLSSAVNPCSDNIIKVLDRM